MAAQVESERQFSTRPTGTVTLLFSDIEGSTARWESAPEAIALALARHDTLMREAIEARSGYVFKTMGDAFCAAFASASEATAAVVLRPAVPKHAREDERRVARLLGYADARLTNLESSREFTEQQQYEKMLAALRAPVDTEELAALMREGSLWSEDQAVADAMLM